MFFVIQPQSIDVISHVNYRFFYVCLPFWQFLAGGDLCQLYFIYHDVGLSPFPEFVVYYTTNSGNGEVPGTRGK